MTSRYDPHAQLIESLFAAGNSMVSIARQLESEFGVPFDASGFTRWLKRRLKKRADRVALSAPAPTTVSVPKQVPQSPPIVQKRGASKWEPYAEEIEIMFRRGDSYRTILLALTEKYALQGDAAGLHRWWKNKVAKRIARSTTLGNYSAPQVALSSETPRNETPLSETEMRMRATLAELRGDDNRKPMHPV